MNKENMKIFVAGHNGMVGSAILSKLQERNYKTFERTDQVSQEQEQGPCEENQTHQDEWSGRLKFNRLTAFHWKCHDVCKCSLTKVPCGRLPK